MRAWGGCRGRGFTSDGGGLAASSRDKAVELGAVVAEKHFRRLQKRFNEGGTPRTAVTMMEESFLKLGAAAAAAAAAGQGKQL